MAKYEREYKGYGIFIHTPYIGKNPKDRNTIQARKDGQIMKQTTYSKKDRKGYENAMSRICTWIDHQSLTIQP